MATLMGFLREAVKKLGKKQPPKVLPVQIYKLLEKDNQGSSSFSSPPSAVLTISILYSLVYLRVNGPLSPYSLDLTFISACLGRIRRNLQDGCHEARFIDLELGAFVGEVGGGVESRQTAQERAKKFR